MESVGYAPDVIVYLSLEKSGAVWIHRRKKVATPDPMTVTVGTGEWSVVGYAATITATQHVVVSPVPTSMVVDGLTPSFRVEYPTPKVRQPRKAAVPATRAIPAPVVVPAVVRTPDATPAPNPVLRVATKAAATVWAKVANPVQVEVGAAMLSMGGYAPLITVSMDIPDAPWSLAQDEEDVSDILLLVASL
jgi:hypothetical protein